jgi:excinuclease ABC subunit C
VTESQYLESIESLQDILSGKNSVEKFTKQMEEDMKNASALQQYEKAKEIHDTLIRLNNLRTKQNMERVSYKNASEEEYVGIIRDEAKGNAHLIILTRKNLILN